MTIQGDIPFGGVEGPLQEYREYQAKKHELLELYQEFVDRLVIPVDSDTPEGSEQEYTTVTLGNETDGACRVRPVGNGGIPAIIVEVNNPSTKRVAWHERARISVVEGTDGNIELSPETHVKGQRVQPENVQTIDTSYVKGFLRALEEADN